MAGTRRAKPPQQKAKPKAKAKAKAKTKPKPKAKPAAKAKPVAKARPKPQPKPQPGPKRQPGPRPQPQPKRQPQPRGEVVDGREPLGEITAPSGMLAVFDVGLVGYLPRPALEPALVTSEVPADRPLPVVGRRVGKGRYADCWDHVAIRIGDGRVATAHKLGEAGVDFARLVCMDLAALDDWRHEDSLDGLADFVFWGRDAGELARAMNAPATKEGHGWTDLPLAEAEARADEAERLKADHHWLLATDLRPHSHHFHALAAARASTHGAGTIDVGRARVCLFFTSWGDGVFPVYLDLDRDDRPVQIRIQLDTGVIPA